MTNSISKTCRYDIATRHFSQVNYNYVYNKVSRAEALLQLIPPKPYCTDDLSQGLLIQPRETAIRYRYLQLNGPDRFSFMVFDIDREGAAFAASDCGLPAPTYTAVNPANAHAHIMYRLAAPVYRHGREKPLAYLGAISRAYAARLGADPSYAGLIAKNPAHNFWRVIDCGNLAYALDELADYAELDTATAGKERERAENPEGRNCELFKNLRLWAYSARSSADEYSDWLAAVAAKASELNIFSGKQPLSGREVASVAKSVAEWTWRHMTPGGFSSGFAEKQRARIRKRWEADDRKTRGLAMLAEGRSMSEIARELGVTQRTVSSWRRQKTTPETNVEGP